MTVTLYSKPGCGQCMATQRKFTAEGIEFEYKDMSVDPEAHAEAKSFGYLQAPVIVINGGEDHWSGYRPDKIDGLVGILAA